MQIFDALAFSIATAAACAGCGVATSDLIRCQQKYDFPTYQIDNVEKFTTYRNKIFKIHM